MKVIEKIEISYFRSFSKETKIIECKDLNIFSGKNDSGKSNILRALNLFFTDNKVDFYDNLYFKNDFSKARENIVTSEQVKGKKLFKIRILFNRIKFSGAVLPEKFWIEKTWDKDGSVTRKTKNKRGQILKYRGALPKVESSTTQFLKKIHFLYIPAIKDYRFFNYLKNKYQQSLGNNISKLSQINTNERKTLEEWKDVLTAGDITNLLSERIDTEARGMMRHFLSNAKEVSTSNFIIPELDFSKVLDITTENDIPLSLRGDGVQTKFIPQILNEISRNNKADIVIWGFEEPENSFEYYNAQQLANKFQHEYSINKQIFLTTHSFNFISLNGDNVSRYRVWKNSYESGTQVKHLIKNKDGLFTFEDSDQEILERELGIIQLNQELEEIFSQKKDELEKLKKMQENIQAKLERIDKPILFVEDKYDQIYKISWLKINEISCNIDNYEQVFSDNAPFLIHRAEGASSLEGFLRAKNIDYWKDKKIIGLFDFDETGVDKFKTVKRSWKKTELGELLTGYYLNRSNTYCFCSLLIPIPERLSKLASLSFPSFIEIENLLPDSFLKDTNNFAKEEITTGETRYLKIKSDKKSILWKKLFTLDKSDFHDFNQLYKTIDKIFNSFS